MIYFFIGFVFIFIDWPIALGAGTLDVFPTVLGYALLIPGAMRLKEESKHFSRVLFSAYGLLAVSVAELVLSLLGVLSTAWLAAVLSVVMTLAFLYLTREIAEGAKEMEARRNRPIGADKLQTAWGFLAIGSLLSYLPLAMANMYLMCVMLELLSYGWFEYSLYLIHTRTKA